MARRGRRRSSSALRVLLHAPSATSGYLSDEDHLAFKKDLVSAAAKIDIGAIFSAAPVYAFKLEPLQREFIIDIDLTVDFLDGLDLKNLATVDRCWPLMPALRVLDRARPRLVEHLWVYSGRRHSPLVCDTAARMMSNESARRRRLPRSQAPTPRGPPPDRSYAPYLSEASRPSSSPSSRSTS